METIRILGIETSCDETAAAVVVDGRQVVANVVSTQIELHRPYGGVVPEIASRKHIEAVVPVVEEALEMIPDEQATGLVMNKNEGLSRRAGYYYGYYGSEDDKKR